MDKEDIQLYLEITVKSLLAGVTIVAVLMLIAKFVFWFGDLIF